LSCASLACIVTEPSLSGIHDMERVLSVCRHFSVPAVVCVNKFDINEEGTRQIEEYCASEGVDVVSRIPFDTKVTEAQVRGVPIVEYTDDARLTGPIKLVWQAVCARLDVPQ